MIMCSRLVLVFVVLALCVINAACLVDDNIRAVALTISEDMAPFDLQALLKLCPDATGEIQYVFSGRWVAIDLKRNSLPVLPAGPIVCATADGIDLGHGYNFADSVTRKGGAPFIPATL